jgi:hypothetical protein
MRANRVECTALTDFVLAAGISFMAVCLTIGHANAASSSATVATTRLPVVVEREAVQTQQAYAPQPLASPATSATKTPTNSTGTVVATTEGETNTAIGVPCVIREPAAGRQERAVPT